MALTNFQIEKYFDQQLKEKLTLYSHLLDSLQDKENSKDRQDVIIQLNEIKKEITMLITIVNDIGFKNVLSKYDINIANM